MPPLSELERTAAERIARWDWKALLAELDERGAVRTPRLFTAAECRALRGLYARDALFRTTVVMARHNFGEGEYRYFARPLPPAIATLRRAFYPRLVPLARAWAGRLESGERYPASLDRFLARCRRAGQLRPTPLLLRYEAGGYNCLHQDLYGEVAFPLQVTVNLSRPGRDYEGGEFLLVEQRPRAQSRGEAVPLAQGEAVIFATRYRPVRGKRGDYRVTLRHGVSRLGAGSRYALGIIFHDAA